MRRQIDNARELNQIIARTVTIFEATTATGATPGKQISFQYLNPITRQIETAQGTTYSNCGPGKIAALRLNDGSWVLISDKHPIVTNARTDRMIRRRPAEVTSQARVPMLVRIDKPEVVEIALVDGRRWTVLEQIPRQIRGCPPPPFDPNAPPSPTPGYPGYWSFYFTASGNDQILIWAGNKVNTAGYAAFPGGVTVWHTPTSPTPWRRPQFSAVGMGPDFYTRQASPPIGFLAYSSWGVYDSQGYVGDLAPFIENRVTNQARMDFSYWLPVDLYQRIGAIQNPLEDIYIGTFAVEVVHTMVYELEPGQPPPAPSDPYGPRSVVVYVPGTPGDPGYTVIQSTSDKNGDHGWRRTNQPDYLPPPPPDPEDPDGGPAWPKRQNRIETYLAANGNINSVVIRHSPNCADTLFESVTRYRVSSGSILPYSLTPGDWRGQTYQIPMTNAIVTGVPKCAADKLQDPTRNVWGGRVNGLILPGVNTAPTLPQIQTALSPVLSGTSVDAEIEAQVFNAGELVVCSIAQTRSYKVKIPQVTAPQNTQGFSKTIVAIAPVA